MDRSVGARVGAAPVSIHTGDPFLPPEGDRSAVRRLRGRLVGPVTLWTAGSGDQRAGLTVTSIAVADGAPGRVAGLIDAESDLWEAAERTGRFALAPLAPQHRHVADVFGGVAPAPGGPFRLVSWQQTEWGPVLVDAATWCGCRVDSAREFGYGLLVEASVDHIEVGGESTPLAYYRGRYRGLDLGH